MSRSDYGFLVETPAAPVGVRGCYLVVRTLAEEALDAKQVMCWKK